MFAILSGDIETINLLLEWGAAIDLANKNGHTPLLTAANNGYFEIVKILVDRGADVNCVSKKNSSALMRAAFRGDLEMFRFLLDSGANPDLQDDQGRSAIQFIKEDERGAFMESLKQHAEKNNLIFSPSSGSRQP